MILVDTSIWVEVLRGRLTTEFVAIVASDEVVTCLPVIQEVLQGFTLDKPYWVARAALAEFTTLEPVITRDHIDEAIHLYRAAERSGNKVRSGVDCLIAVCALRNGARLLHRDRDYDKIAKVSDLLTSRL